MNSWNEAKLQNHSLKYHKYCTVGTAFNQFDQSAKELSASCCVLPNFFSLCTSKKDTGLQSLVDFLFKAR